MSVLLEARPYRPFKSSEEYLIAMKEDLAEWLNALYPELRISLENFMDRLDTGVALCKHANYVRRAATDYIARRQARKMMTRSITSSLAGPMVQLNDVAFLPNAKAGTFFARDNVSNFISWCRNSLGIIDCLLFESDDLIMRKNERHVILCLLEVARRGAKFGMLAPMLVQMERQIDREIAAENKAASNGTPNDDTDDEYEEMQQDEPCLIYGPQPQIVTNDLKSLDEMVRDLVEKCSCPTQFPMIRVSEGKYRIGDTKVLIFVRILRSHVMVRVGGGWDTLSHYLDKHDPCRCRTSHRSMISAKLIQKAAGSFDLGSAQVHYERSPPRTRRSSASSVGSSPGTIQQPQSLQTIKTVPSNRSRSPTPHQATTRQQQQQHLGEELKRSNNRSQSPTSHQTKSSPIHQIIDLDSKQRSRSPTPKLESGKSSGRISPLDSPKKILNNEDVKQINKSRLVDNDQDTKKTAQESQIKVTTSTSSEEFSKRYVVDGGVARRTFDKDDTPKFEPSIYNYKCGSRNESSTSRSPTPSPPAIKEENVESFSKDVCQYSKSGHDGEHSDNGSEMSDEGYRSLGTVQPTPTTTNTTINATTANTPTVVDCQKQPFQNERSCVETESIETGLRKTKGSTAAATTSIRVSPSRSVTGSSGERTPRANSMVRENSNLSRCSSGSRTPREGNSSPEGSPLKRNAVRNSMRKLPPGGTLNKVSAVPRSYQNQSTITSTSGSNTWNGRQSRKRPGLSSDTFVNPLTITDNSNRASPTNFSRKNTTRQSLPKTAVSNCNINNINGIQQYDRNGRRIKQTSSISLQSSPTKVNNPLLEQIIRKVGDLQDEKKIVEKLQDLLRDYQSNDSEKEPNLEFTRAWIDGNGTVALPSQEVVASPRKDPKSTTERGNYSRIPAPIYKRAMSVNSDSI